ncbi:MAG: 30S ribosomal protein S18 [Phycisphaerae bacterium]|jgi:small subunit ribosomal protein S18|nr:30S ribosomal protein S18 [Phycisphaerae bacterium]
MARKRKLPTGRSKSDKKRRFREQAKCRFCRDKIREVDYKDIGTLAKLTTNQGKMFSRKRSGNCAKHQRSTKRAVKRARFLGLMPYLG